MNDRRHLRREGDTDKERWSALPHERRDNPETASILNLQGSAGNRAVAQLLEVQLQPPEPAPGAEPTDTRTSGVGTMNIPDLELTISILNFSRQGSGTQQPKTPSGEASVSFAVASMDPRLVEAMTRGTRFAEITVAIGTKATIKLHGVMISGINVSGDTASLTLSFDSMEFIPGS